MQFGPFPHETTTIDEAKRWFKMQELGEVVDLHHSFNGRLRGPKFNRLIRAHPVTLLG